MNPHRESKFFRLLWSLNIMPKWKLFFWKLWHNCLAVASNLRHRGIDISELCQLCSSGPEDCPHLFRLCPLASSALRTGSLGICSQTTAYIPYKEWILAWLLYLRQQDGAHGDRIPIFVATLWAFWCYRNDRIFKQSTPDSWNYAPFCEYLPPATWFFHLGT